MNAAIAPLALALAAEPTPNVVKVTVEPTELTLTHPRFGHALLVTGFDDHDRALDLTSQAVWSARTTPSPRSATDGLCRAAMDKRL